MFQYDPKVPPQLKEMQEWFGAILENPNESLMDAGLYISPGLHLNANERMEIYHRIFWSKHLSFLIEAFPRLYEELGESFNQEIVISYLKDHPVPNWSLYRLGEDLPEWIENPKWKELAETDRAFKRAFVAAEYPPLTVLEENLSFVLQPFVQLVPSCYLVVYRSFEKNLKWKNLEKDQFSILSRFRSPMTLEEAFADLEIENPDQLSDTFQLFISRNWLTCKP